jgi:hypothetical protein
LTVRRGFVEYNATSFELAQGQRVSAVKHIELNGQGDAVKQFFLKLPVDADGSIVEIDGHAVARVLPFRNGPGAVSGHLGPWTEAKNDRRCALVDRDIDGTLTSEEAAELAVLQEQFFKERRKFAPVPLEDLRRLHQDLLAKAQEQAAREGA